MKLALIACICLGLAGCAPAPPPSAATQADTAACTNAADATYNAQNYAALSRTSQNGLLYPATPTQVFGGQQLGALHQRDSQITDCERNGNQAAGPTIPGPPPVTPHIVP